MTKDFEVLFMKVRLLRIAANSWKVDVQKACDIFYRNDLFKFIEDCYDIFHTEGDFAVFGEITAVLKHKGGYMDAKTN